MIRVRPREEDPAHLLGGTMRSGILLLLLALLQTLGVYLAIQTDPNEPFSLLLAFSSIAPFLALAILISPLAVLLLTPLLVVAPGTVIGFTPFEWIFVAAVAGATIRSGASGIRPEPLRGVEILFVIYVIWAGITVTQAVDLHAALEGLKQIIMSFLFFLVGARLIGRKGTRALLRVLCLLSVVIAAHLVLVIVVKGFSIDLLMTRILGLTDVGWGRANYIAAVATLTACAALVLVLFGRGWERVLGAVGMAGALFVQIVTMSRGGAVALLGGILLAGVLEGRRRLLPAATMAITMVVLIAFTPMGQALILRFMSQTGIRSVGVRFLYYQEAWSIARSNWFLGVGPNQIPEHSAYFVDRNPHNFLLKNAADLGVVGVLLFLGIVIFVVRRAVRLRREAQTGEDRIFSLALILALGVGVVNASYEPTFTGAAYSLVFWLMIGSLTAPSGGSAS